MDLKLINEKLTQVAKLIVCCLFLYAIGFAIWTLLYRETGNGDNVEHLHATWLVANGKVPYRDFFQHHNPLLWYIFAPLIKLNINLIFLLNAAHAISIICGVCLFYVVYKICIHFLDASKYATLLALLTICPPYFYIFCFNYNPDTFMALFYAIGLYFLFSYWEKADLFKLAIAFISFFLAFMFTQKILVVLGQLGGISLWIFYKNKTPISDIVYATMLPILGLGLFISYLYNQGALEIYWKSNYLFNVVMQKYYGNLKINVMDYEMLIIAVVLSVCSIMYFFNKKDNVYKVISILFIIELGLRSFYFSISPYYMLPLMIYMCCLNSVFIDKFFKKHILWVYPLLFVSIYYAYISVPKYSRSFSDNRSFARFLSRNITPCDYVLSGFLGNQSIVSKDPHYYWAMFGHIDIAGQETGVAPMANFTELVLKYKPKLIYGGVYWNNYEKNRNKDVFVQQISPQVIDKYYNSTPFTDFYLLKKEYQGKKCLFDTERKEWIYGA